MYHVLGKLPSVEQIGNKEEIPETIKEAVKI